MTDEPEKIDRRGAKPGPRAGTEFEGRGGNVPHVPTDEQRAQVEKLARLQITQHEIGDVMGISADTIQRHYKAEFTRGRISQNVKMREHAYTIAYGKLKNPDKPEEGYVAGMAPDGKMAQFLLERQFGMIPHTKNEVSLTDLTPEAAAWLGRETS